MTAASSSAWSGSTTIGDLPARPGVAFGTVCTGVAISPRSSSITVTEAASTAMTAAARILRQSRRLRAAALSAGVSAGTRPGDAAAGSASKDFGT
ncbi:MAG TPA: hypothetical protein VFL84_02970 [Gammaproteobacteria bacterium]|nr:hypothetical protein [Gammaproteobacteria bacterium]